jgi:hypothetical protein
MNYRAYVSGLIDAVGLFRLVTYVDKQGRNRCDPILSITLPAARKECLKLIVAHIGGSISEGGKLRQKTAGMFHLHIKQDDISKLVEFMTLYPSGFRVEEKQLWMEAIEVWQKRQDGNAWEYVREVSAELSRA